MDPFITFNFQYLFSTSALVSLRRKGIFPVSCLPNGHRPRLTHTANDTNNLNSAKLRVLKHDSWTLRPRLYPDLSSTRRLKEQGSFIVATNLAISDSRMIL